MDILVNIKNFSIEFDLNLICYVLNKKYIYWNFVSNISNDFFSINYINNNDDDNIDKCNKIRYDVGYLKVILYGNSNAVKEISEILENIELYFLLRKEDSYFIKRIKDSHNTNIETIIEYKSSLITIKQDPIIINNFLLIITYEENKNINYIFKFREKENLIVQRLIL